MLGATLLAVSVPAPTPGEVLALVEENSYCVSQVHSLSNDCEVEVELVPQELRNLACEQAEWPGEWVCKYDVLMVERSGLYPAHWVERFDLIRLTDNGDWWVVDRLGPMQNLRTSTESSH